MKTISNYEQQAVGFLAKTNTHFIVKFVKHDKHFDDDDEKRNIYKITLKRGENKYIFNFGQSISESCKEIEVKKSETLDSIEVFAGLSSKYSGIVSVKFKLFKKDEFNINDEKLLELVQNMEKQYFTQVDNKNKALYKRFENGEISRNYLNSKLVGAKLQNGAFYQCIQNAIKRELSETITKYIESDSKIPPTAYDVLACLTKSDPGTLEDFCNEYGYDLDSKKAEKTYKAVKDEYNNVCMLFSDEEMAELSEIQ